MKTPLYLETLLSGCFEPGWLLRAASLVVALVLLMGMGLCLSPCMAAQNASAGEYQVKAAFVFNFLRYVKWPPKAPDGAGKTLAVCIYGENVFDAALDKYRGEVVEGRKVVIAYPKTVAEAEKCQVLIVSPSESRRTYQLMKALEGRNILTVSDIANFTELGGIIGFYLDQGYIRFDINLANAHKAELAISSQLLRHARVRER